LPLEEQTYREGVVAKLEAQDERMKTFEADMRNSLTRLEVKADSIERQTKFTNGKVRKIIIAMIFLGGIVIGQTFANTHDIIQLIAGSL